jgi:alpha-L-fucosidase
MFIHWGLYAIPGRGEWVREREAISREDYAPYFSEFNPVRYNPAKWAKTAKSAGIKYAVITAKHHEGFCLFDSKYTDYKATNTPAGRDLLMEFVEAFRNEGIKIGFYYSLFDWNHPDYPHYGDMCHPERKMEKNKGKVHDFPKYLEYMHNQVRELLSNYGKIDIMWFDFSYGEMTGEKWEATNLIDMVRSIQPHIIVDNRLITNGLPGGPLDNNPLYYAGDFYSPEQIIPTEGYTDDLGRDVPWESCVTLNNHWGYGSKDLSYTKARNVIQMLANTTSKNGNLLINIGPNAKGEFPDEMLPILEETGKWLEKNGESIYGCGKAIFPKPEWGRYTQKGNKLYAHIYERGPAQLRFDGLINKVKAARLLSDGSELTLIKWRKDYPNDAFIDLVFCNLPDENDTVIEFELEEETT